MLFDIAIYDHHASSPAHNNACELVNITDSQCICIIAVTADTVSIYITVCVQQRTAPLKEMMPLSAPHVTRATCYYCDVDCGCEAMDRYPKCIHFIKI